MGKDSYFFGLKSEKIARKFLEKNHLSIIGINFHSRFGEIDIIAEDENNILHFIEVKATSNDYDPLFRITKNKYEKIIKTIEFFMLKNNLNLDYQLDAIIIKDKNIEWIPNISY